MTEPAYEDVPLFDVPHPDTMTEPPFGHHYDQHGTCTCGQRKDQP